MSKWTSDFLAAADRIGARLCRDAIFAGDHCNWIGASMEWDDGEWTVVERAFGSDLYAGTSGIALFLARLSEHTRDAVQRRTARAAFLHARSSLASRDVSRDMGLYSGVTGIVYALAEGGEVFLDDLAGLGLDTLRTLPFTVSRPGDTDVISGGAGAILGLLAIARRRPEQSFLNVAMRLGDSLIERAYRRDGVCSWRSGEFPVIDDLTGLSHGAAGIALSLLELWAATGEARFRDAAEAGFAYERSLFSEHDGNWPDLRLTEPSSPRAGQTPTYMTAWCHGAAGIGLSRLRAFQLTSDDSYRCEAQAAVQTTTRELRKAASSGYSLCHGTFGNAELLLAASDVLADQTCRDLAEAIALEAAASHPKDEHWLCGVPGGGETPNLMLGIAGIGYHFLRLYDNCSNPSVLTIT